jgi:hypothetical protein
VRFQNEREQRSALEKRAATLREREVKVFEAEGRLAEEKREPASDIETAEVDSAGGGARLSDFIRDRRR